MKSNVECDLSVKKTYVLHLVQFCRKTYVLKVSERHPLLALLIPFLGTLPVANQMHPDRRDPGRQHPDKPDPDREPTSGQTGSRQADLSPHPDKRDPDEIE